MTTKYDFVCDHMKAGLIHLHNLNVRVTNDVPQEADDWYCSTCIARADTFMITEEMNRLGLVPKDKE